MSVSSVDLEMQSPAHPLPTAAGSDDEEDLQCWRDVKAETGFSSYKSFLGPLPETGPQIEALLANIRKDASCIKFGEVHVLDILENGDLSISMRLEGRSESTEVSHREERDSNVANELKDCTQLLRNLRSPRENSRARVIVWSIPQVSSLHSGPVAAIGLGLKIQPAIFATLLLIVQNPSRVISRMESDSVIIGNSIATVARNYVPNEGAPPVLFVAKVHHRETTLSGLSQADLAPNSYGYLSLLSRYVQKGAGVDAQSDGQLLNAILPLLHLEVLDLHTQCEITQDALLKAQEETSDLHKQLAYQSLDKQRFGLRRMLEGLEESKICFVKFARLHDPAEWLEGQPWISQKEEIIERINTARAKEAEARDYMQLQIGNLSILESRKSIQLSNQQISEAKRGTSPKFPKFLMAC